MLIPREGKLYDLNMAARYDGPGPDGEVSTVTIGDVAVSVYVTYPGIVRISVHTDTNPNPLIMTHDDEGGPLLEFSVNGNVVHMA